MGSFEWRIVQVIQGDDIGMVGTLIRHMTFAPYPGLGIAGCGVFRDAMIDQDPVEIVAVVWIATPELGSPGHFKVFLEDAIEEFDGPANEAVRLYGTDWKWNHEPINAGKVM